jgi:hypothetical protein
MSGFVPSVDFLVASWPPLSPFGTARGPLPDLAKQAAGGVPARERWGRGGVAETRLVLRRGRGWRPNVSSRMGRPKVAGGRGT